MQLVFECSYHTNVDHLHSQSCVPGFSVQYSSFHFTCFLMSALKQVALGVQLTFFLVACAFLSEADVGIWV